MSKIEIYKPLKERLRELNDKWFLMEPAYFMTLCTHKLEINPGIKCAICCGGGYIYLNEDYFKDKSDKHLEECVKIEILRILLKHPYQRQLPNKVKMYLSSNFVIANNLTLDEIRMTKTVDFFKSRDYDRECLEVIYHNIKFPEMPNGQGDDKNQSNGGSSGGQGSGQGKPSKGQGSHQEGKGSNGQGDSNDQNNNSKNDPLKDFDDACKSTDDALDRTQMWKEDEFRTVEINSLINKIDKTNSWGTVPGNVVDTIKESLKPKFNYKALFERFRSTVISSARQLTRMKPNRRFGYDAMGSKREFTTKILVAVDTSGSISDEELKLAMGFINGFFKYGIDTIDCIQFDTQIYPDSLCKLKKEMKRYKISGRGGTDFNGIFQYVQDPKNKETYNGVIIFTDGYASIPDKKWLINNFKRVKYLWCLSNKGCYENFKSNKEFEKFGPCTYVEDDK